MSILPGLQNNKGTISSALGKELAQQVLEGNQDILLEALSLVTYDSQVEKSKNVRAGAAKIVEKTAEKNPELVAPYLEKLIPALSMPEPQTRWMVIHTIGFCASFNPEQARGAAGYAKTFLTASSGTCLLGSTVIYLGYLGALSTEDASFAYELLEKAAGLMPGQTGWILDAFLKMYKIANRDIQEKIRSFALSSKKDTKKVVQKKADKLLKVIKSMTAKRHN